MNKHVLYGAGALGAIVIAAAVLKRKSGRKYIAAAGDTVGAFAARFGLPVRKSLISSQLTPGRAILLPQRASDKGPRVGARGKVTA